MSVYFSITGVKHVIHLDWLAFSVHGIKELPIRAYHHIPGVKRVGAAKTHENSFMGEGVTIRTARRKNCANADIEIELRGTYFKTPFSIDAFLKAIYEAGGHIRLFRVDFALDIYGAVKKRKPCFQKQHAKSYREFFVAGKYSGYVFGKSDRVHRFYDKRLEQQWKEEYRGEELPENWWRYEVALRGEKCGALALDGMPLEAAFDKVAPSVLRGSKTFYDRVVRKIMQGFETKEIKYYIKQNTTLEGSYNALFDDVMRRIKRFHDKHIRDSQALQDFATYAAEDIARSAKSGYFQEPRGKRPSEDYKIVLEDSEP